MTFAFGGNTRNPDALHWEDTYANIGAESINLTIGEKMTEEERRELTDWLK